MNLANPAWLDIERFWQSVTKSEGCWTWNLSRDKDNYGQFWVASGKNRFRAHRFSWMLLNGDVPEGMCVLHHCDNPPCVRPDHLFIGTQKDNVADRDRKGRTNRWPNKARSGEKNPRSILTVIDVKKIRSLHKNGVPRKEILSQYTYMSHQAIDGVLYNKNWKHV